MRAIGAAATVLFFCPKPMHAAHITPLKAEGRIGIQLYEELPAVACYPGVVLYKTSVSAEPVTSYPNGPSVSSQQRPALCT